MLSEHCFMGDFFLLISGSTVQLRLLTDPAHLSSILKNLPQRIGMNAIREPIITVATNNPGLEGYVPIDESNITISTYTNVPRVVLCVHSCKAIDASTIIGFVRESFACESIRSTMIREGNFS